MKNFIKGKCSEKLYNKVEFTETMNTLGEDEHFVCDMIVHDNTLWFATNKGVFYLREGSSEIVEVDFDEANS